MKAISIGLLLAVIGTALGLEIQYSPPAHPEQSLQSLDDYYARPDDLIVPAHRLDDDGYHYKVGRRVRREALQPATFNDIYQQSRDITKGLPDSDFLGPSPDEIALPESDDFDDDNKLGPAPDQIARPSEEYTETSYDEKEEPLQYQDNDSAQTSYQPVQQHISESAILAEDGYHYKSALRSRYRN